MNGIRGIIERNGKIRLHHNYLEEEMHCIRNLERPVSYVEVVLYPATEKWWLSPKDYPEEWEFSYTSYHTPGWFHKKTYEDEFRKTVYRWWKKHVLYHKEISHLSGGIHFIKDCHIGEISGNTRLICCDSFIQTMKDTTTALKVNGRSFIDNMTGNSRIKELNGYSFVHMMQQQALIQDMNDNTTVKSMVDCTRVETLRDHSRIYSMVNQARVGVMRQQAVIYAMHNESIVEQTECLSHILSAPEKLKVTSSCLTEPVMPFA